MSHGDRINPILFQDIWGFQRLNRPELAGAAGAAGLMVQIAMGFALADNHALISTLLLPHMIVGLSGLALVAYLAWRAFSWAPGHVRALYGATLAFVLAQAALGLGILVMGDLLAVMIHEADAIAILFLFAATEALASRARRSGHA